MNSKNTFWYWKIPIYFFYFYILYKYLKNPNYQGIFGGINLGMHEFGHMVLIFFGEYIHVVGGTLFQILLPTLLGIYLYKQQDYFGVTFIMIWLGTNFFNIATYIADAQKQILPLVSIGIESKTIHDWNYLLGKTNLLDSAEQIAMSVRGLGIIFILTGIATATLIFYKALNTKKFDRTQKHIKV